MLGYSVMLASDVFERDGVGLELRDPAGARIAEVFRDDRTGQRVFNTFGELHVEPDVLRWFLEQAAGRL